MAIILNLTFSNQIQTNFFFAKLQLIFFTNFSRQSTIVPDDEIINIMGRRLRGLSPHQVTELLNSAYKTGKETNSEIDIVISRNNSPSISTPTSESRNDNLKKTRKISLDSFMKSMVLEEKNDEYASTAIKYVVLFLFFFNF